MMSSGRPRYATFLVIPGNCTMPRLRQSAMYSVWPKYIQWTRRWNEVGSGTGRKSVGCVGEEGRRRGSRLAGTSNGSLRGVK